MSSLRKDITRTLLRLSRFGTPLPEQVPRATHLRESDQGFNQEGRRIGRYRIIRRLGAGGMGHVYLALDTGMGRHVALKFLSPDLIADPEMLQRLQAEGATTSSLNHPNILTIYEIGELEGERFIVTEYVEGATLRLAIERKLVDVPAALDIATQVASALVAAHAAGIVHRDLKPGNIMIREDGYVKVIDFGLAKRIRRPTRRSGRELTVTRPGVIVGTVHYMSPEQAGGGEIDGRSDIWSLGVILFELVTGQLPFDGNTETDILLQIRDHPVPQLLAGLSLPPGLEEVIHRALRKDPAERFQSARELLAALERFPRPETHQSPRPLRRKQGSRYRVWFAAIVAVLLLSACWQLLLRRNLFGPAWFQVDKVRQLTFNGRVILSCLSPDGKYLAYVAGDPEGLQTLYLSQLNTATEQIKVAARRVTYWGLRFSPENEIYAVSAGADLVGKLYVIPLIGEAPERPVLTDIDGPVAFSPSGDRFAFVRYHNEAGRDDPESAILVANSDGSQPRRILSTVNSSINPQISWSPREDKIEAIFKSFSATQTGETTLHLFDLKGNDSVRVLPHWGAVGQSWWTRDGRTLLLTAASPSESTVQPQLRQIDVQTGETRNITRDLAGYKSVSLTRDDRDVAAVKVESRANLWISEAGDFNHGQNVQAEMTQYPTLSWSRGDQVLVNSQRGGFQNLWQFDVGSFSKKRLTNEAFVEQEAIGIPGAKAYIFASNRSGQFKLWKFEEDTNRYTQLTSGPTYDRSPTVSPDGQWVVYTSWFSSSPHLFRVRSSGGATQQISPLPGEDPHYSPDGKHIVALVQSSKGAWSVGLLDPDQKSEPLTIPGAHAPMQWSPDGSSITSVITKNGASNLWAIPIEGGEPRRLTSFDDQHILQFAFSPDGARLACLRTVFGADVELFTQPR